MAGLPGPGLMQQWYADGVLQPLDFVDFAAYEAPHPAGFAALGKAPDGKLAGIFTKGAVKGLIWYNTGRLDRRRPGHWEELKTAAASQATGDTKTWCIGLESGGDSGWPGTDWIEDIVLRQAGTDVYDDWVAGTLPWTDRPRSRRHSRTFGDGRRERATAVPPYVNGTNFGKAANPLFRIRPAACSTTRPASSPTFFDNGGGRQARPTTTSSPSPTSTRPTPARDGGGDLFGMFNDTPQAQSLIQYLADPGGPADLGRARRLHLRQQERPARRLSGRDLAASRRRSWPTPKTFRFDASDLMPAAMNDGVLRGPSSTTSRTRSNLDAILSHLDNVQADAYSGEVAIEEVAGRAHGRPSRSSGGLNVLDEISTTGSWRRDRRYRRALVLIGYILARSRRSFGSSRDAGPRGCGRGCGSRPALAFLGVFLVYPTIAHDLPQLPEPARRRTSSGSTTTSAFFSQDRHAHRAAEQRPVGRLLRSWSSALGLLIAVLVDRVRYETQRQGARSSCRSRSASSRRA